jgi:hypothetical protein
MQVGVSLDETVKIQDVEDLLWVFGSRLSAEEVCLTALIFTVVTTYLPFADISYFYSTECNLLFLL